MAEEMFCTDCKMNTVVVFDHATGDIICTECALVLEEHYIDETPEWRIFTDDSKDNDPVRVGEPITFTTSLCNSAALSTIITFPKGTKANFKKGKNIGLTSKNYLDAGFNAIANMADRLALVPNIKYRASELYKKAEDQKRNRGRNHDAIMAACVYVACSQENKPRTIKEICSVANGTTMKEFTRAKNHLMKQLEVEMGPVDMGTVHAGDLLRRFCSYLGMDHRSVKAAQEVAQTIQNSDKIDVRRNPTSVAAAIIYIITQISKEKKPVPFSDIAIATGVTEGTIRNAYKDIYPHIPMIVPSWFAKTEDLRNLYRPRNV